jgi:hypothetical protein
MEGEFTTVQGVAETALFLAALDSTHLPHSHRFSLTSGRSHQLLAAASAGRRERFQIPAILPVTGGQDIPLPARQTTTVTYLCGCEVKVHELERHRSGSWLGPTIMEQVTGCGATADCHDSPSCADRRIDQETRHDRTYDARTLATCSHSG